MLRPIFVFSAINIESSPTGQLEFKFVENLDKTKYNPIIICYDGDFDAGRLLGCDSIAIHKNIVFKIFVSFVNKFGLSKYLNSPDLHHWYFERKAKKIIDELCKAQHFDYIHTISFPSSSHLVGLYAKRKYGLKWIAQLYDPWLDNVHVPLSKSMRKRNRILEGEVAANASKVLLDSDLLTKLWRERYSGIISKSARARYQTLPLATTIKPTESCHKNKNVVIISHIGNFYKQRMSLDFIKGVGLYMEKHPFDTERLKVNYIGRVTDAEVNLIKELNLNHIFNLVGTLHEEECEDYYSQTDIFLAVDVNIPNNIFFPSKILKYLYYKKPILAITSKVSVMRDELMQAGHYVCNFGDTSAVSEFIYKALHDFNSIEIFNKDYCDKFKMSNVLSQYDAIVDDIIQD